MSDKRTEIIAGCVAGFVAIPQCVALGVTAFAPFHGEYSTLAQVTGFASAIVAGFFVAFFGRGQISLTGPRIGATIVIAGTLTSFLRPTGEVSLPHEVVLGLILIVIMLAGAIQAFIGHIQLASLHNYIARPVIVGLLTGVAATMVLKQVQLMFSIGLGFSLVALATAGLAGWIWWLGKSNVSIKFWEKDWIVRLGVPIAATTGVGIYFLLKSTPLRVGGTLDMISQFWVWPEVGSSLLAALSTLSGQVGLLGSVISAALMLAIVASIDTTNSYVNTKKKLDRLKLNQSEKTDIEGDDENNELKWHGIGNLAAAFFGGMTSSASDARATAAVGVGGRTWIAGSAYVIFLCVLLVSSPHVPWTNFFPLAVISGLMLQIAVVLLSDQWIDLRRYWNAIVDAAKSVKDDHRKDAAVDVARQHSQAVFETAFNGVSVFVVALSLNWFDPLKAVSLGMFCSMSIFLLKIGQSQRHLWYSAVERESLEMRSPNERDSAFEARNQCYVVKLHGDYFFLSRKKTNDLFNGIIEDWKVKSRTVGPRPYVIVDFDMAHEFDESGVSEIKVLIEKLRRAHFTVLLSYLSKESNLYQLMKEEGLMAPESSPRASADGSSIGAFKHLETALSFKNEHMFVSTERAINFVEDEWIKNKSFNCSKEEIEAPRQLQSILNLPRISADSIRQTSEVIKFWIVYKGNIKLQFNVRQSVADIKWCKVLAEVGLYGVISERSIRPLELEIKHEHGTELIPVTESFIDELKITQPIQAAVLLEYLLEHMTEANAILQLEALMLDH